jgi:outer membrane receptor protein involved in Fe transport
LTTNVTIEVAGNTGTASINNSILGQSEPTTITDFVSVNNGATDTLDGRANLRLGRHDLATAGFEYEHESIFQSSIPSFSSVNNTTDRQRTVAVFAQDQIFLLDDRLQISLGARGQFFSVSAADRPGFLGSITPERSLTGDGSIAYFVRSSGTKLRAHVGNGFRAPSLFERFGQGTFAKLGFTRFGDPTLRAEQSISIMNSYFIPERRLRRAFRQAVRRGVSVRVIVPSKSMPMLTSPQPWLLLGSVPPVPVPFR